MSRGFVENGACVPTRPRACESAACSAVVDRRCCDMGQASPRCRSSGDEKMKQSLPHVAGGSADTIEPAVSSFLQPPMTSCRPHPAGAVQVSGAVQPPTEKPCLDPGSLAGPGSLMPSDGKRPSHHPALPTDRSSRPRSVRGDGGTMRAISRRGTRWIDRVLVSTPTLIPSPQGGGKPGRWALEHRAIKERGHAPPFPCGESVRGV